MSARFFLTIAVALFARDAGAAERTRYGGDAVALVYGTSLALAPDAVHTSADASLSQLVYESLYSLDAGGELRPVLARGLPELKGTQLVVPIRMDAHFHDGHPLTASAWAQHLTSLVAKRSPAVFAVMPVKGVLARLTGDDQPLGITANDADGTLSFDLIAPYSDYARLLAAPHAAIVGTIKPGASLPEGSGPFVIEKSSGVDSAALLPFRGHRDGRPFLDRLSLRLLASRSGALAQLRRGEAGVVFGVPDVRALKQHTLIPWNKDRLGGEMVILGIGDGVGELATMEGHRAILASIDRATLARRFLGQGAEPIFTLLGASAPLSAPAKTRGGLKATLIISDRDRDGKRVAERVQLDLLQVGITVVIERVTEAVLAARRHDRRYDLMIDTLTTPLARSGSAIDDLHNLLALAALRGRPTVFSKAELVSFIQANEEERKRSLPRLDEDTRLRAGIVPIAMRVPAIAVAKEIEDWTLFGTGVVDLASAHLPHGARR